MRRNLIVVLVVFAIPVVLSANPSASLTAPAPGQYNMEQLWKVTLSNPDSKTYEVWLEGTITEAQKGQVFWAKTNEFQLPPGTKVIHYADIQSIGIEQQTYAQGYEEFAARTGGLPEGNYTFTVKLEPAFDSKAIHFSIKPMGPLRLISPGDGSMVSEQYPFLAWAPPTPRPPGPLTYGLKLCEVKQDQAPEEALLANPTWFEQVEMTATSLKYRTSARPLRRGMTFAWQVVASSGRGETRQSDVWSFTLGSESLSRGLAGELFYYGTTDKVPLSVSPDRVVAKFSSKAEGQSVVRRLSQYGKAERTYEQVYTVTLRGSASMKQVLAALRKLDDVVAANPMYLTVDSQEMGVTDEICLGFKKEVKQAARQKLLSSFGAVEVPRQRPWEKWFSIVTVGKNKDALAVANRIKESGLVEFAHPDFVALTEMHAHIPNDEFFPKQFYLNNTGQLINDGHAGTYDADIDAPEAWDISRGSSAITIAVIDEGVERQNNDLPTGRLAILNGSNFAPGNANDPDAVGDGAHGTCCAGAVAAEQDNTQGVTGVAPLCRIMPVRIPFGYIPSSTYANAENFAWTNGADVLSNSWGYNSSADIPVITAAINNAITMGRGGIGSVVVWSAGNTANHNGGNNGFVSYPGCVAVANVLTVGASDRSDKQANYSPTGAAIDLVAPSHRAYSCQMTGESFEAWSTDIVGTAGYNPAKQTDCGALPPVGEQLPSSGTNYLDYTGRFGGTSHACPEVAGVAALMLSVNPTLTPAQVFDCITNSADKVGGYTYTDGKCYQMGFGRLNAFNCLSAQLWMKDAPSDPGTEPNSTGDLPYLSEDIWVRQIKDGGTTHQNAQWRDPNSGIPNEVYVRVRNAGNVSGSGTLKVYWAKASSGLAWPAPWDGTVAAPDNPDVLMGDLIGTASTGTVPVSGEVIVPFDWYPPNPFDYSMFGPDQSHFCLLARVEEGMAFPETPDLAANVTNNNNIVWKNIVVNEDVIGGVQSSGMLIANYSRREELTRITFTIPGMRDSLPLYRYGSLTVTMSDELYKKWRVQGGRGQGFRSVGRELQITSPNAWIGDFGLKPNEISGLQVKYKVTDLPNVGGAKGFTFSFDVQQLAFIKEHWQMKGGQRYEFRLREKQREDKLEPREREK